MIKGAPFVNSGDTIPSSLIVEVAPVEAVHNHPNADRLDIIRVKGWSLVVGRDSMDENQLGVYFPVDTLIPSDVAQALGVDTYLKKGGTKFVDGEEVKFGRVGKVNIRQVPSYGIFLTMEQLNRSGFLNDLEVEIGQDVAVELGLKKWEPPAHHQGEQIEGEHPLFNRYTSMQHLKNFPIAFDIGEEVIATEKIHGQNWRAGVVRAMNGEDWQTVCGSHRTQRIRPEDDSEGVWWKHFPSVEPMIERIRQDRDVKMQVLVYGERYGDGVQDMTYGLVGEARLCIFDIQVDGQFMAYDEMVTLCDEFGLETPNLLYRGPYEIEALEALADGPTTMGENPNQIREGLVIKPEVERWNNMLTRKDHGSGRVILKCVGSAYYDRPNGTEWN